MKGTHGENSLLPSGYDNAKWNGYPSSGRQTTDPPLSLFVCTPIPPSTELTSSSHTLSPSAPPGGGHLRAGEVPHAGLQDGADRHPGDGAVLLQGPHAGLLLPAAPLQLQRSPTLFVGSLGLWEFMPLTLFVHATLKGDVLHHQV